MLFNLFIFVWVIVVLIRHKRGRVARKQETVSTRTILRMMFSISGVMFLFGLTWLFAILLFTVIELQNVSQYLFTIFNSLQGFFIFAFILNTELSGWIMEESIGMWLKAKVKFKISFNCFDSMDTWAALSLAMFHIIPDAPRSQTQYWLRNPPKGKYPP